MSFVQNLSKIVGRMGGDFMLRYYKFFSIFIALVLVASSIAVMPVQKVFAAGEPVIFNISDAVKP